MEELIKIDNIDDYNRMMGVETLHPLVTVIDASTAPPSAFPQEASYSYGVYALFLKQTYCGDITYGRQPYDYQEGTVTSFAPGQVVHVKHRPDYKPNALGLLFHPDMISGTSLGKDIKNYGFFSYSSTEALHLSDDEKKVFKDCLQKIQTEIERPIDRHTKTLVCRNIELLLDYCMRFYDRQFITRAKANHDILERFDRLMDAYFEDNKAEEKGLPSVKYFADKLCLSANYFGDLFKKETGKSPQEYIQERVIELAKERISTTTESMSQIAYSLGFQYPQHLSRMFKKRVGCTPNEYRNQTAD